MNSTDALGFTTANLKGNKGTNGKGWTGGSYNATTGIDVATSVCGLKLLVYETLSY